MLSNDIYKNIQIAIACLFLALPMVSHSQSSMKIYTQAPAPEELAEILFPKRYRGIVINDDTGLPATSLNTDSTLAYQQTNQQADMFGLLINFEYDSTTIVRPSLPLIDAVGEMLQLENTANRGIIIEGHADATGSHDYNQGLSERRARAIRRYLVSVFDIDPKRLVVIGKGEQQLHDVHNPTSAVNRRVVFKPLNKSPS